MEPGSSEFTPPSEIKNNQIKIEAKSVASLLHPDENQDCFSIDREKQCFGVYDGIGGQKGGYDASRLAMNSITESFKKLIPSQDLQTVKDIISDALVDANSIVSEEANKRDYKIGTTATIGTIWQGQQGELKLVIGNVGDSRAYLLRDGKLSQITIDDNNVRVFFKNNKIEIREAQTELNNTVNPDNLTEDKRTLFNNRNGITQAIGEKYVMPNVDSFDLLPNDRLFLCSDGVSDNLTDNEIEAILNSNPDLNASVQEVTKASQERSRQGKSNHPRSKMDDITALVIDINSSNNQKIINTENSKKPILTSEFDPNSKNLRVQRSDGNFDYGWEVLKEEDGQSTVVKGINGQIFAKTISTSKLERLNRPAIIEDIPYAENPKELLDILHQIGGIKGSVKKYSSDEIYDLVTQVLRGKLDINVLTSAGGLRNLVRGWIENKKQF